MVEVVVGVVEVVVVVRIAVAVVVGVVDVVDETVGAVRSVDGSPVKFSGVCVATSAQTEEPVGTHDPSTGI